MSTKVSPLLVPPIVQFFAGRSESFIQFGSEWRRMSPEDLAHFHTGYDRETREPNIGIYIIRRPNGLLRIGFDLHRLDFNLRRETVERLRQCWSDEAANLSNPLRRSVERRAHFSKSFAQFEVEPRRVEAWKDELIASLENPESFTLFKVPA